MRNSGRVLLRLLLQHDGRKTSNRLACLLPGGASWSLQWSEGWGGSVVWAGGVAWVVCQPPMMLCAGGHAQDPPFAPGTTEGAVGFWPFCILSVPGASLSPIHQQIFVENLLWGCLRLLPLWSLPSAQGGSVWCGSQPIQSLLTLPPFHEAPLSLKRGHVPCITKFPPPGTL